MSQPEGGDAAAEQPSSLTALLASIFAQAASPPPPPAPHADPSQDPALRLLATIQRASSLADSLSLFSDNDALEDLSTSTLRVLFLHSVWAEAEGNVRTVGDLQARKRRLEASKVCAGAAGRVYANPPAV